VKLSEQQEQALERAEAWRGQLGLPGSRQCFVLAGYAGTGKTTLAQLLAGEAGGRTYFASYTGKAAHVLRKTGIEGASTIHRLIYQPRDKCDERLRSLQRELESLRGKRPIDEAACSKLEVEVKREKENLRRPEFTLNAESVLQGASLVVVDEYSMVSSQVGRDLASFGAPVLALGDPGQLPPVRGDCYFGEPDFTLTEIHRQAQGNPIVQMSMVVRRGEPLRPGQYGESRVVLRRELPDGELDELLLGADQILVGTNQTRRQVNREVRKLLGREGCLPVRGDKLVCLRNSHDEGLLNGQTWTVRKAKADAVVRLSLENEDGDRVECLCHRQCFEGKEDEMDSWTRRQANEFDFGYALTVHKSQGSQWGNVLLFDEWRREDRPRWLYTGVTRASEKITVVR
jgi:exodeoxyribonuclease-5